MYCGQTLWSDDLTPKPTATLLSFSQRVTRSGDVSRLLSVRLHVLCFEQFKISSGAPWHAEIEIVHGIDAYGQTGNSLLTLNRGLAMFIALIGNWVGTPALFSSGFVPLDISRHDFRKRV